MKSLWKQIKPFWPFILFIIMFQIVQSYTTLLLPDYTSKLIDVGIQDKGFEYAVPFKVNQNDYDQLVMYATPEERQLLEDHYELNQQTYHLKETVQSDQAQLESLSRSLTDLFALFGALNEGQEVIEKEMQREGLNAQNLETLSPEVARTTLNDELDKLGPNVKHSVAVHYIQRLYESTGGSLDDYQMSYLLSEGKKMGVLSFISLAAALCAHYISAKVGAKVGRILRRDTFKKVLSFSQEDTNEFSTASLITRSTNDIQQIQMVVTLLLRMTMYAPILAAGAVMHVLKTNVQMSWIIALAVGIVVAIVGGLLYLTMPKFKLLQQQVDEVNLQAREVLTGLEVIRAFGRQNYAEQQFDKANIQLRNTYLFTNRLMSLMMPLMMIVMNGVSVLIVWTSAGLIADGQMQVGAMTAFINYTIQIIFAFLMVSMMAVTLPRALVSADRVQEVLDKPLSIKNPENPVELDNPKGVVEFHSVDFAYPKAQENTLTNLNFKAEPGKTTAIIGSTGSGKSTLVNLMLRFYDVTSGSITIDGVDIRDMDLHHLRELIGLVTQKAILFSGTIASNIKYGAEDISQSEMEKAAEIAHASEFIEDKNRGYDSRIAQGGGNVSGGQKQRLSIARAIAKDPLIYIFDDSFSALDYSTDASLRQALNENVQDATVFIVAQRISTIINAEQIIVLDHGEIAGIGDHSELMKTSRVYREIATSQLSKNELDRHTKGGYRPEDYETFTKGGHD